MLCYIRAYSLTYGYAERLPPLEGEGICMASGCMIFDEIVSGRNGSIVSEFPIVCIRVFLGIILAEQSRGVPEKILSLGGISLMQGL